MPELYGNKFKWQLRQEIRELKTEASGLRSELWQEQLSHRRTNNALRYAQCEIEELKTRLQNLGQKAQVLANEANRDTKDAVEERFINTIKRRRVT